MFGHAMAYPGGKSGAGVYQAIINEMPPHDVYCEPFLGGGGVMLAKRPATRNIGIDLSGAAIARFSDAAEAVPELAGEALCLIEGDALEYLSSRRFLWRDLVYCDPPYVRRSRRSQRALYDYEMTDADHRRLLRVLRGLPCMVMVSGYRCDLYDRALTQRDGWRRVDFQAMTRRGPATESLWCNFSEPSALHDYRYLGANFRERERIKRKRERWRRKWAALPVLERRAIMSAIEDASSSRYL
ncbi:MAG: DNA adenine methylase [Hyphococcus sp.]